MTALREERTAVAAGRRLALFLGVLALAVLVKWGAAISGKPIAADDSDTVRMAHNLAYHGVLSDGNGDGGRTPAPTNYREPFPAIVLAGYLLALDSVAGPRESAYFEEGEGARLLRYSNILWGLVACASVFAAVAALTHSPIAAVAGAAVAGFMFETGGWLAEPAAAALLALFSLLAMMAVKTGHARYFGFAGLVLGLLVLTKAAFLYVGLALFAILAVWVGIWGRQAWGGKRAALGGAFFALGALAVIGPWVARNHVYLGVAQVTQRAGIVLYTRAIKNQMTATEYAGSFYAWGPPGVRHVIGSLTGFGPEDLRRGGRLQRLNRHESDFLAADIAAERDGRAEDVISFYRQARAERKKLTDEFERQGLENPKIEADALLQKRAVAMILGDPVRHIQTTLPFLWRGAFYEAPPLLLCGFLALFWRRADLLAFVLPALAMVGFYAVASHNITRYNDPVLPVLIASLMVFAVLAWRARAPGGAGTRVGGSGT